MTGKFIPAILDGLDAEARVAADAYDSDAEPETSLDADNEIANRCRNAKAARANRIAQQSASGPAGEPVNKLTTETAEAGDDKVQAPKCKEQQQMLRADRHMSGHALEKFNFSDDFQDLILACMMRHPEKFSQEGEVIAPKLFNGSAAYDAAYEFREWFKKRGTFPDLTILGNLVYQRYASRNPDRAKECVEYVKKLARLDTSNADGVREMVSAFAKERAIQNALRVAMDASYQGKEVEGGLVTLFENAIKIGGVNNTASFGEILNHPEEDGSNLLGKRFLFRGGSLMLTGPTGIGKSALALQMAVSFALGTPALGIAPQKALQSLIIQAENDTGDLREMALGVCKGLSLEPSEKEMVGRNIHFATISDAAGSEFLQRLNGLVRKLAPDLVWLDPLFSFLGESAVNQEAVSKFLRNGLNPIIQRHRCGLIIIHHQNKPSTTNPKRELQNHEWAYAAAGSAELSNWPRAIMSVQSTDSDRLFRVVLGKRGRRAGILDEVGKPVQSFLIKHHPEMIYWDVADHEDAEALDSAKTGEDTVLALIPESKPVSLARIKTLAQKKGIGVNRTANLLNNLLETDSLYCWERKEGRSTTKWYARFPMPTNWKWT